MSEASKQVWLGVVGVVAILGALAAAVIAIGNFGGSELLLGMLSFAGAIVVASIQYRSAKEKEVAARLFTEKQAAYTEMIATVMGFFHEADSTDSNSDARAEDLARKLQKIRTKLVVWGSAQTIIAFDGMGSIEGGKDQVLTTGLRWFEKMFTAIRSDLGHKDPAGVGLEIALGMLKPNDRSAARSMLTRVRHSEK